MTHELHLNFTRRFTSESRVEVVLRHPLDRFVATALMGASGSGKTTTLRVLAGLERPDHGMITFAGETWCETSQKLCRPPQQRGVGLLFQDYALFPHLNVLQNVGFGLTGQRPGERAERVGRLLDLLQLRGLERRYPQELSGGQQQRVALARTVAPRPRLLLLDEPLSALDWPTRRELRSLLREFLKSQGIPTVLVTHDPHDVLALADRVVVLEAGRVLQAGDVPEVFERPASQQVARLLRLE